MLQVFYGMMVHIYLACMLRTYRTYNLIVRFSKYEFNNKFLSGVTLLKIISGVTLSNVTLINNF